MVRVAQEALTNVRKHAPGAAVRVALDVDKSASGAAVLSIGDAGSGCGELSSGAERLAGSGGGYGLRGMRERAELLGGSLRAGTEGDGWLVELRLPLEGVQQIPTVPAGDSE